MASQLPLKPSLLDKLMCDMAKEQGSRALPYYVPPITRYTEREVRNCIQRDIAWLLNDICFAAAVSLDDYPEVATSVLNFGLPELTGRSIDQSSLVSRSLEIANAIKAYEERLRPDTINVHFDSNMVDTDNKLRFSISGEIRNALDEAWIEFNTTVDLDDGHVEVAG